MLEIRLFIVALQRFKVGQNPTHIYCSFYRVYPPAKMASEAVKRSIPIIFKRRFYRLLKESQTETA